MDAVINNNTQDKGNNFTFLFGYYDYNDESGLIINVVTSIIICTGIPLTFAAIYALYSQVKNGHVAPIYVINLLISDLIQLCCMIVWVVQPEDPKIYETVYYIYHCGVVASVCFMECIALERYLVIVHPLWYRFKRTIKITVVVCVVVWGYSALYVLTFFSWVEARLALIISTFFFLLPLPLLLFFLCGTLKALSASISVTSEEKRRIVGILILVLLIYSLLFLPGIIVAVTPRYTDTLVRLTYTFLRLSPLADLVLYVFMRKGIIDKLLASVCCCKMESNESSRSTEMSADPQSAS